MTDNVVLTCVYCGYAYPDGTPAAKHELLTEHIRICEKHPLREAEEKNKKLRSALVGFLGVESKEELDALEVIIRSAEIPNSDRVIAINAIDALRDGVLNVG